MVRKAFSLIEMIFAIVLIAIVVVAVPQMLSQNVKAVEGNRAQEAVFLSSAAAKKLLSYRWDANSKDTNVTSELDYAKILDINATPGTSERVTETIGGTNVILPLRAGNIKEAKHRRFHSVVTYPAGANFNGNVSLASLQGADAFKFNYTMNVNVNFVNGFGDTTIAGGATNTKMALIQINNADTGKTDVVMRIYAFNIGETDYAKRTFQ